jgi:hypothetical protein
MAWRLHLSNRTLLRLDILAHEQSPLLAAWVQAGRVAYFDLVAGHAHGEKQLIDPGNRRPDHWTALLPELRAPNGLYPPVISGRQVLIYVDLAGEQRLYHETSGTVYQVRDTDERRFETSAAGGFVAAGLHRTQGLAAALDSDGHLHLYQGASKCGMLDSGLAETDSPAFLSVNGDPPAVYLARAHHLLRVDAEGRILKQVELPYSIGAFAVSSGGMMVVCGDAEANVLRVYDGDDLRPHYQRHAADLFARARQVQLIADLPPTRAALNRVAINDTGTIAFALAGMICVAHIEEMRPVNRMLSIPG